jgi:chromosomal replication initiator protein
MILQSLRASVSPECFSTWFKDLCVMGVEGNMLRLSAPNRYVKVWVESHYKRELLKSANAFKPEVNDVEICVLVHQAAAETSSGIGKVLNNSFHKEASVLQTPNVLALQENSRRDTVRMTPFSPKFKLETFRVGISNRLAHSAAQCVVESPGEVYNPLFIHGAHGVGKTHLLQGIGHLITENRPKLNVIHISCEEFTNAYIIAVQTKRLDAFRARFRNCDVLLVDDVQFLGTRERTQEEFLYTFDALRNAHKQVVICADCHPRDIKKLDSKLATRFQSGLVARLDVPDQSLRLELLCDKAKVRGLNLSDEVAETLAAHINSDVRSLEGAICKLMALMAAEAHSNGRTHSHSSHSNHKPDRELAIIALRELGYLRSGPLTLQDVLTAVSKKFSVTEDDLRGGKRHSSLVHARHVGMYLSRTLTGYSVADIGRFYGNRDHSTVLHAAAKITEMLKRDEELKSEIQTLRQYLGR